MSRWIGTSFKMTKNRSEAASYAARVRAAVGDGIDGVQPFLIPSATAVSAVADTLGPGSPVLTGVQNAHWDDAGAWTGEISVPQAADAGARLVEIGHSERRAHFAETDETVRLKTAAALRHGLTPLVCVGEDAAARDAGRGADVVRAQAEAALEGQSDPGAVLLAYEPVWAIGEHGRPPRPEEIAPALATLAELPARAVLYGGSVDLANAPWLLELPGVQGLFVGRAAWDVDTFLKLLALGL
ncbi:MULTISPECIES: triose-phosphate isomerase [unclassified Streptomyces]|uniref:triose-phosphate isomerase n=1 Tax=unclassified Streptomyces TaxID=2593676 RepID=UPI002E193A14|nr:MULTISPECIES: triose-phosphate isomerase [unclassified Streptomyces]